MFRNKPAMACSPLDVTLMVGHTSASRLRVQVLPLPNGHVRNLRKRKGQKGPTEIFSKKVEKPM